MMNNIVGVIGAGVMGTGVAQDLACHGMDVALVDVSEAILERAKAKIKADLRFQGLVHGTPKINRPEVMARINFTTRLSDLGRACFVIENVSEKWEIKN